MSNSLAIAAVTATLRNLLDKAYSADHELSGTSVTTMPPDRARDSGNANQVNIFLYHTAPNAAWRNMDIPQRVKGGEVGFPPLALNLYYIITAYGQNNDEIFSHRLLGRAMSVLHDHGVLRATEIESALPGNDLFKQVEQLRITPETLSSEDMHKLWSAFQTNYRISAAYQASVVLIESARPVRAAMPVLTRGADDGGISAGPGMIPPFPTLEQVVPPNKQPSAKMGDLLTLTGHHLDGNDILIRFNNRFWSAPIEVAAGLGDASTLVVNIPAQPADPHLAVDWTAGFYTVAALFKKPGEKFRQSSNELSFSVAPDIVVDTPVKSHNGTASITVNCTPEVAPGQSVTLLVGDLELAAQPHETPTGTLRFAGKVAPGEYFVRLRVDGVDSLLVDRSVTPPVFNKDQMVTIT